MEVVLIDHYDSFTHNVIDWLRGSDDALSVRYVECDDVAALRELATAELPLVISPGPKRPEDAVATLQLLRSAIGRVPVLGICLGHQMLALLAGGAVVRVKRPLHGSTRQIQVPRHAAGLLRGLPPTFNAAVYNSLTVAPGTLLGHGR